MVIWKLATILAILCGQRASEVLAVKDLRNICFEKDVFQTICFDTTDGPYV